MSVLWSIAPFQQQNSSKRGRLYKDVAAIISKTASKKMFILVLHDSSLFLHKRQDKVQFTDFGH